jgi:hypothetical protein
LLECKLDQRRRNRIVEHVKPTFCRVTAIIEFAAPRVGSERARSGADFQQTYLAGTANASPAAL